MKRLFLVGWMGLLFARLAGGQSASFINNTVIFSPPDDPPQGWASNYVNNSSITVGVGVPFFFYDVVNYTNRGPMMADTGFIFDTTPSNGASNFPAAQFGNASVGIIAVASNTIPASVTTPPAQLSSGNPNFPPIIPPQLQIFATNIFSSGVLGAAADGFIILKGNNVNLNRGSVHIETFGDAVASAFPMGIFDQAWEVAAQNGKLTQGNFIPRPNSPQTPGLNPPVSVPTPKIAVNIIKVLTNLFDYQFVFAEDTGGATVQVGFQGGNAQWLVPAVQWTSTSVNSFGQAVANNILLTDQFETQPATGLKLFDYSPSGQALAAPTNYTITTPAFGGFLAPGNTNYNTNFLSTSNAFSTNPPFSANTTISFWAVQAEPFSFAPDPSNPNQSFSDVSGRIEITAEGPGSVMDLTRSRILGPNVLRLNATNHFAGSSLAHIEAYDTFLNLGSTNGQLNITNVVAPFVSRPNGPIEMWSAMWVNPVDTNVISTNISGGATNITTNSFTLTNRFHVLLVSSSLFATAPTFVAQATLRSTNVVVSDILNIQSNLLVNAQNLTITSNRPPSPNQFGEIVLGSSSILWSPSFPILQNLTNFGLIEAGNSSFFSHRADPNFQSPGDTPYQRFVNHNEVVSLGGNFFWANYFESTGLGGNFALIDSGTGGLTMTASNALVANGEFDAFTGDMSFTCGNLTMSNQFLLASTTSTGGSLTLTVVSNLTDGNSLGNFWETLDGLFLPVKPATGDLLGTSIQLDSLPNAEVDILWPGADLGPSLAGYSNNVALGDLILNGGDANATYHFIGAGPGNSNAMYVDLLELSGGSVDGNALELDPNFTIYFNRATNSTTMKDLTLTLDGATVFGGGQLHQVAFTGLFQLRGGSSVANNISLSIALTNPNTALISWPGVPNATNGLYSSSTFNGTNWNLVTNIVEGATSTTLTVPVSTQSGAASYYQLRASPVH